MDAQEIADVERVTRALGRQPIAWREAGGHGAPSNRRWVVTLPGGATAFVKIAAFDYMAEWLRSEHANYVALQGSPHVPRLLGWDDDGVHPVLAIEDLTSDFWPPPWSPQHIDAVLATLDAIHAEDSPSRATPESHIPDLREGWTQIANDPSGFLRMQFASEGWLLEHNPILDAAARSALVDGETLIHFDVRSDNLCLRDDRAILVDWNLACRGDPAFDIAGWLPSLADEGGPDPWEILPNHGGHASLLAGFFCSRAGLSPIPQAPHARPMQLTQGRVALAWAARELDLPPPA